MAQATIEDLADQLTAVSDKFVASFQNTMEIEDQLTSFLRGRQRWYVGTQKNSQTGSTEVPPVPVEQAAPQQAAPTKKRRCPKPRRVKTSEKEKEGITGAQKAAIIAGVGVIITGVAIALADGPQPGPSDAAALPIIIQGANRIIPFLRPLVAAA